VDVGDMVMTVTFRRQLAAQHGCQAPQLLGTLSQRVIESGVK
jgi:hypothetical protein